MANGIPFSLRFRDHKNQTATMRGYQPGSGADDGATLVQAIEAGAAAISNANVKSNFDRATAVVTGASAEYDTVEDKAVFTFTTAAGDLHRYSIAAPKASIFQADAETVDYANADVITFVGAMLAGCVSRDGRVLTASVGGTRKRSLNQRRFNIFTRNPALTGQGL